MNPRIYNPAFLAQAQHLQNKINKLTRALSFIVIKYNLSKYGNLKTLITYRFSVLLMEWTRYLHFFLWRESQKWYDLRILSSVKINFMRFLYLFRKIISYLHKIDWDWWFRNTWKISERMLRVTSSLMNPGIEVGLLSIPFDPMFLAACFLFLVASPSDRWNSLIKKSYSASDIWMRSSELHETYTWFYRFERHFIYRSPY